MLIVALISFTVIGCLSLGVPMFVIWAIREHYLANKYRELLSIAKDLPTSTLEPKWVVTYKVKGVGISKFTSPEATSEGDALKRAIQQGIGADKILSIAKE